MRTRPIHICTHPAASHAHGRRARRVHRSGHRRCRLIAILPHGTVLPATRPRSTPCWELSAQALLRYWAACFTAPWTASAISTCSAWPVRCLASRGRCRISRQSAIRTGFIICLLMTTVREPARTRAVVKAAQPSIQRCRRGPCGDIFGKSGGLFLAPIVAGVPRDDRGHVGDQLVEHGAVHPHLRLADWKNRTHSRYGILDRHDAGCCLRRCERSDFLRRRGHARTPTSASS